MPLVIIPACEHCVLEADPSLPREIVSPYELENFVQIVCLLYRHHLRPFVRERIVKADCEMTSGLIQILLQLRNDPDRGQCNPLRTPAETPVRRQHLDRPPDIFIIVERLPHSHEYGPGKFRGLIDGYELGQDVRSGKIAVKALPACHAEAAAHLAARLGGDAQRFPVLVRNHHGFDAAGLHPARIVGFRIPEGA